MTPEVALALIGAALGSAAFVWRLFDALLGHLHLDIEVQSVSEYADRKTAVATLDNRGALARRTHYVAVLIGPESESLRQILRRLLPDEDRLLWRFGNRAFREPYYSADGLAAALPLHFLFREQNQIAQETVKAACSIDLGRLKPGMEPYQAVLVVISRHPLMRRWRLTSTLFYNSNPE
jgi:hypothetical protein